MTWAHTLSLGGGPSTVSVVAWTALAAFYECDQHSLYVNLERIKDLGYTWPQFVRLACHELGHTMGLTHGTSAQPTVSNATNSFRCMKTPCL